MRKHILLIVVFTVILKLSYFLFAVGASKVSPDYRIDVNKEEFLSLYKRNDSFWYEKAANEGYPKITNPLDLGYSYGKYYKQSVWAHFPMYPLTVMAFENVFSLNFNESAFFISIIFAATTFIGFYLLCVYVFSFDLKKSLVLTGLFMVFPFHYYFSMYYTEAMFFSFLAFSFIAINRRLYWLLSVLIVPLTLVRPNGIACLIPLFVYYIEIEGGFKQYLNLFKSMNWQKLINGCYFLTAPLALGVYCLYQKQMTDHYFAFIKAQSGWYKEFMFPLLGLFRRGDFTTQFNSVYTILVMVLSAFSFRKFSLSLNILIWISILLPMTSGSVACMPRYISVIFPLTVLIGSYLVERRFFYLILGALFILQLVTFYPWLIYHPFSF